MNLHMRSPKIAFLYGMLWGTCAYTLHLYGIIIGVVNLSAHPSWWPLLPGLFLVLYLALSTGVFWAAGAWCEKQFIPLPHLALRAVWLWLYWLWITYGSLFFCGRWEGYLLANPLLPWAAHPQLLWPVSWCGVVGATLFLCVLSVAIAHSIKERKYILLSIIFLLFGAHCLHPPSHPPTLKLRRTYKKIEIVTTLIASISDDPSVCFCIAEHIACAYARNPNLCAIIFPESCVYPWRICAESLLAEHVTCGIEHCDYIVGSFYDDNGLYRNSCYWLRDGILQKRYDKRHAMPLIERLPWFLHFSATAKNLFFKTMPEIVPSSNERPLMQIGEMHVVPYICSELFINRTPDDNHPNLPIVALINDRWAPTYLQELIYLGAVMQAHAWQREILYVSYTRKIWIDYYQQD